MIRSLQWIRIQDLFIAIKIEHESQTNRRRQIAMPNVNEKCYTRIFKILKDCLSVFYQNSHSVEFLTQNI